MTATAAAVHLSADSRFVLKNQIKQRQMAILSMKLLCMQLNAHGLRSILTRHHFRKRKTKTVAFQSKRIYGIQGHAHILRHSHQNTDTQTVTFFSSRNVHSSSVRQWRRPCYVQRGAKLAELQSAIIIVCVGKIMLAH